MKNVNRRDLLQTGLALTVPFGAMASLGRRQESSDTKVKDEKNKAGKKDMKEKNIQIQYLEIVTPKVDEICKQYSAVHGVTFGDPVPGYGNARTAKLSSGGLIGVRAPMRSNENPVVRPYSLVDNLEKAVAAAKEAGAEVAIPRMELPGGNGSIAIVILGGIDCGFWQN